MLKQFFDRLWSGGTSPEDADIYAAVHQEISSGHLNVGLWTKALAASNGDIECAKSRYIEMRANVLRDERRQSLASARKVKQAQRNAERVEAVQQELLSDVNALSQRLWDKYMSPGALRRQRRKKIISGLVLAVALLALFPYRALSVWHLLIFATGVYFIWRIVTYQWGRSELVSKIEGVRNSLQGPITPSNPSVRWARAYFTNIGVGIGIAFGLGVFFAQRGAGNHDHIGAYLLSNILSGYFWGQLAVPAIMFLLVIAPMMAVLMCFPFLRKENGMAWLIVLVPVFFVARSIWMGQEATAHYAAQSAEQAAARVNSSSTSARTYEQVLATLEQQYPQLNPDSHQFDQGITESVAARMNQYTRAGRTKADALELAVADFAASAPSAAGAGSKNMKPGRTPQVASDHPREVPQSCSEQYWRVVNSNQDVPVGQYQKLEASARATMERCASGR